MHHRIDIINGINKMFIEMSKGDVSLQSIQINTKTY